MRHPSPKEGILAIAPQAAIYGARNEAIALMNCPKVKVAAKFPPCNTVITNGLIDVCISALPIPSNENDISISSYDSPKIGKSNDTTVMMRLNNTVFLRPILFINIPVGTEKNKNQKKTSDGNMFALISERCKSALT